MIILLTGPTGSGKTDTSWELLKHFDHMVFLDCDWFASMIPFSWQSESDVQMVYQSLATMIKFHKERGQINFVITLTLEMAQIFHTHRHYFEQTHLPIHAFRLECDEQEIKQRITIRNRLQKDSELINALLQKAIFDTVLVNENLFTLIDTTNLSEHNVAMKIKNKVKSDQS